MNHRDELARIIDENYEIDIDSPAIGTELVCADAILAAGYRKVRTITTAEELDALPEGAIIREGGEYVVATRIDDSWWYPMGPFEPNLPVTVLHDPREAS